MSLTNLWSDPQFIYGIRWGVGFWLSFWFATIGIVGVIFSGLLTIGIACSLVRGAINIAIPYKFLNGGKDV